MLQLTHKVKETDEGLEFASPDEPPRRSRRDRREENGARPGRRRDRRDENAPLRERV